MPGSVLSKAFSLKTLSGSPKYPLLSIAVKNCCSLQNGNATVELNLCHNKNTLTKERASLGEEALKALRLSKKFVRHYDGAHKVIVSPELCNSISDAYKLYKTRKRDQYLAAAQLAAKKNEEEEASKITPEMLE